MSSTTTTSRNTGSVRWRSAAAALLLAAGSAPAQIYETINDCRQTVRLIPPPGGAWGQIKTRQFVHAFENHFWSPISASVTPYQQTPGFNMYGIDYYVPGMSSQVSGRIINRCFTCYPTWTPAVEARWLERNVYTNGTPPWGFDATASPGSTGTRAYSVVHVAPYTPTGPLDINLRAYSRWVELSFWGDWGRGFAWTEVRLPLTVQPGIPGGGSIPIVVSFTGFRVWKQNQPWYAYPPTPIPVPLMTSRLFDPIIYRAESPDGTLLEEGTVMESTIDILGDGVGDVGMEEVPDGTEWGTVKVDAQNADMAISIGHPRAMGAAGHIRLSVRNGMVVTSEDDGVFDGLLPGIGSVVPLFIGMPLTHSMVLDLAPLSPAPFNVEIVASEGGTQPLEQVEQCPADQDHDGAIAPVDVAVFVGKWSQSLFNGTLDADFDGNGSVAPADVAAFVAAWSAALASGGC